MNSLTVQMDRFLRERVLPVEGELVHGGPTAAKRLALLREQARHDGVWALPLPRRLGGGGIGLTEYAEIAEREGLSDFGPMATGSESLLDVTTLDRHATEPIRERYLAALVAGTAVASFGMTEPGVAGSDPAGLTTRAVPDGDGWRITGRKWFTSRAGVAAFTTVVCRTEPDAPTRDAFSLLLVPTDAPGYRLVRELPVLGAGGQYEIELDGVWVPGEHLVGARGGGLGVIGERLALGRTLRCLRWLGQAGRAFDLLCARLTGRQAHGGPLADRQLLHGYVFDSHAELAAARALTRAAVTEVAAGGDARIAVGTAKVVTARALHAIVDRAIQVYGAEGLTDDTPLPTLARTARAARILDGPDELHVTTVARRLLAGYR